MAQHTGVFSYLKAKILGDKIIAKDRITLLPRVDPTTFADDDYITQYYFKFYTDTTPSLRLPFSNESGLVISWQTDLADGTNTYFVLYANNLEAFVYFMDSPGGQPYTWTLDGDGNIDTVTFEWGTSQSGYIKF